MARTFPTVSDSRSLPSGVSGAGGDGSGGGDTIIQEIGSTNITFMSGAAQPWTNMPLAVTEFLGTTNRRIPAILTNRTRVRFASVAGAINAATGAKLHLQYSLNSGASWNYMDHSAGPQITVDAMTVDSVSGAWVNLNDAAKADVLLRLVGSGGNGTADPTFAFVVIEIE